MPKSEKNKYMCFICGDFSEVSSGFCSINFHKYEPLQLNEKENGYAGSFQQGYAHLNCLKPFIPNSENPESICPVCQSDMASSAAPRLKIAVYTYREKGCAHVIGFHEKCFSSIKKEEFFLIKPFNH